MSDFVLASIGFDGAIELGVRSAIAIAVSESLRPHGMWTLFETSMPPFALKQSKALGGSFCGPNVLPFLLVASPLHDTSDGLVPMELLLGDSSQGVDAVRASLHHLLRPLCSMLHSFDARSVSVAFDSDNRQSVLHDHYHLWAEDVIDAAVSLHDWPSGIFTLRRS